MLLPLPRSIVEVADQPVHRDREGRQGRVDRLWSDDIAVWRAGARRDDDKARALRVIDWFISVTPERHYEILDRQLFETDRSAASSSSTSCTPPAMPANRSPLRVCIVIKVGTDGLINRIDEYFDPAGIAPLLD